MIGIPAGVGVLFPPAVRTKLKISLAISLGLSVLDMLGIVAMLPLLQVVTGSTTGPVGFLQRRSGIDDQNTLILVICAVVVGVFLVKSVAGIYFRLWQTRFLQRQQAELSTDLFQRYLDAPYAFHLRRNPADLLYVVGGAVPMGYGSIMAILATITEATNLVVISISLLIISPLPALGVILFFAAFALTVARVSRRTFAEASEQIVYHSERSGRASMQGFFAVKELKLRNSSNVYADRYLAHRLEEGEAATRAQVAAEAPKYLFDVVFVLGIAILAAALFATGVDEPLVLLGLFVVAGARMVPNVVRLVGSLGAVRVGRAPLQRMVDELAEIAAAEHLAPSTGVVTDAVPRGDIEVDDIHFSYADAPDVPVLDGISLTIPRGSSLAIVGSSGAGKSTLVDILLGLQRPASGTVRAGGVSIAENLPAWQRTLGVVPQEVYLTDGSVRENIAFAERLEDIDDERLARAVERSQLAPLLESLPQVSMPGSASAGCACRAGSAKGSASPVPSTASPRCWCSMRPRRRWTTGRSAPSRTRSRRCRAR